MTAPQVIAWGVFEDGIYDWVTQAIGIEAVWADTDDAQPARPYCSLQRITAPIVIGLDGLRYVENDANVGGELTEQVVGQREFTVNLQVFCALGTPLDNAEAYLSALQLLFSQQSSIDYFINLGMPESGGLSIRDVGQITRLDDIEGAGFVSRASMDVVFGCVAYLQNGDTGGYIDSVHATGTLAGTVPDPSTVTIDIEGP